MCALRWMTTSERSSSTSRDEAALPDSPQVAQIMTDSSPGPGWWLASDGNWYPPHLHPDARALAASTAATSDAPVTLPVSSEPDALADASSVRANALSDVTVARITPLDEIRATTGGGIDWEAVARERASQREARNRQENTSRRRAVGIGTALLALIAIVLIARSGSGGGKAHTQTVPSTVAVGRTSSTLVVGTSTPSTTGAIASSTIASPTSTIKPSGPTGSGSAAITGPTGTATSAAGTGTSVSVFSLTAGSCIDQDNLTTGLVTTVRSVPCDQPHTHEVYLKTSVSPSDGSYDAAKVTAFANQACTDGFKAYVGIAYESSRYYFLHLAPSAESWNKNHDRDVVCLLLLEGQKLTASVKGKNE